MESKELVAVLDLDFVKYAIASVAEERTILIKHKPTGAEKSDLKTRTAFYGHHAKKAGGWLADKNKERLEKGLEPFAVEEFEITDVQTPLPIAHALYSAKHMVDGILKEIGATSYKAYFGTGDSFRVGRSTLLKYKGNRDNILRPLLMDEVIEYLTKRYKPVVVKDIEADDAVVMECYGKDNHIIVGEDKDYYGQPTLFYNVNKPEEGIVNGNQFGKLWIDEKKKVRGIGRMFLYFQVAAEDSIDNYKAHCMSDVTWGQKSAYKALVDSKNDKEALENLIKIYKKLYPEPKEVEGWRGDTITIDWFYVMNENFDMARMLTHKEDDLTLKELLDNVGVDYA